MPIIGGKKCEGVTKTPAHGETFTLGDVVVKGVHTPCHTQDSICYFMEDKTGRAVFTGDTLFISGKLTRAKGQPRSGGLTLTDTGCGRFFEGNAAEMHEALNKRLASLPDDTVVYVRNAEPPLRAGAATRIAHAC